MIAYVGSFLTMTCLSDPSPYCSAILTHAHTTAQFNPTQPTREIRQARQVGEAQSIAFKDAFEQVKAQPNLSRLAAAALATAQQGMGGGRGVGGGGFNYDDYEDDGMG